MLKSSANIKKHWETLCQEGKPEALQALFDHFHDDLYAYTTRLLNSSSLAKDAIQNTFADLWQYRNRLAQETVVKAYLFRATRNHAIKLLRKNRPTVNLEDIAQQLHFEPEELYLEEASLLQKQKITAILNTLSPRQREILYLKFYDNLDYQEIAQVLEINYQSVVNHAHKAIQRLRNNKELRFF
ncbi:MAG: DNA-directed RNA polymerase sigma-70 factor [Saprospiraceae bacterium]|nr:MAG: DNA-directed RNA polymerase sigma-70 factor [Saprospiraceae bacterium]